MQIQNEDQERQFLLSESNRSTLTAEEKAVLGMHGSTPTPTGELPKEVKHKVIYGDTLEGLSLEYSVPISRIRQRNHIEGDFIYHLKEIIIPNPDTLPPPREQTEDLLIEEFVAHMNYSQKDRKVARYYLVQTEWNMQAAMRQYAADLQWQRRNKPQIITHKLQKGRSQMKQIKRYYELQELHHKKTS